MRGYYRMHRGWMDNPAFQRGPYTEQMAWAWLIEQAAFAPCRRRVGSAMIELQRGQLAASIRYLETAWRWGSGKTQRFLKLLANEGMIGTRAARNATVITLCNYDYYQADDDEGGTPTGTIAARSRHDRGTNDKEAKKEEDIGSSLRAREADHDFMEAIDAIECRAVRPSDIGEALQAYQAVAGRMGLPKALGLNQARRALLVDRLRDIGGIEGWHRALAKLEGNPALCGRNEKKLKADLGFLLNPLTFARLVEGFYDGWADRVRTEGADRAGIYLELITEAEQRDRER